MPEVKRSALVMYTPEQMFELVRDVAHYPDFLVWVTATQVHQQTETEQQATMQLSISGLTQRIRTHNTLDYGRSLTMQMADGPFRQFRGRWDFQDLGIGCRVELTLAFEFDNPVLTAAFNAGFVTVANRMIDDFCNRADRLYG
ncbi:MAG: type II toxin-antitoxin system RatA family toxin [Pseudomonadota bacterium]